MNVYTKFLCELFALEFALKRKSRGKSKLKKEKKNKSKSTDGQQTCN